MSQETQNQANKTFQITKELIEGYHKQGYTVKEMADKITEVSGIKCSVNTVNRAAEVYNISMKSKPRKNGFTFETVLPSTAQNVQAEATSIQNTIEETREESAPVESKVYSF